MKIKEISLILFLILLMPIIIFYSVKSSANAHSRFAVPTETTLNFSKGTYQIFYEYRSEIDGVYYSTDKNLPKVNIDIHNKVTGESIPLLNSPNSRYTIGNRSGYSILKFNIKSKGDYIFRASFNDLKNEKIVLAVIGSNFLISILLGVFIPLILVLGFVLSINRIGLISDNGKMLNNEEALDNIYKIEDIKGKGYYAATVRIVRIKGLGEYWFDNEGLFFRMFLNPKPILIPFDKIINIESGKYDAGKLGARKLNYVILSWTKNGAIRKSAIAFSRKESENVKVKNLIIQKISNPNGI